MGKDGPTYEEFLADIDERRAEAMPDERAALDVLMEAYTRLKELGFREAIYCPKDGSSFDVIEAGSTGIHRCHYEGTWPDGSWWIESGGDLWPSRPILFRSARAALSPTEEPKPEGVRG